MELRTKELDFFLSSLAEKRKMVAMLAPSFVIDFSYPDIIGKLKRLGFSYVVEVAWGADQTNKQLQKLLSENPKGRYITNPCPSVVRLVKTKYPQLIPFLTAIDTPMSATAKLVIKEYPGHIPVFIGPCIAKKFETREDCPELGIIAITYGELASAFEQMHMTDDPADKNARFDIAFGQTRLYPISGGLAQSSGAHCTLTQEECLVVSWYNPVNAALQEFQKNEHIRLVDALFCEGGCMGGPGIISKHLTQDERRQRVISHWVSGEGEAECRGEAAKKEATEPTVH